MKHELPPKYCECMLPANLKLPSCTPWKDDLKAVYEVTKQLGKQWLPMMAGEYAEEKDAPNKGTIMKMKMKLKKSV